MQLDPEQRQGLRTLVDAARREKLTRDAARSGTPNPVIYAAEDTVVLFQTPAERAEEMLGLAAEVLPRIGRPVFSLRRLRGESPCESLRCLLVGEPR